MQLASLNHSASPSGNTYLLQLTLYRAVRRPIISPTITPTIASDSSMRGNAFERTSGSG